MKLYELVSFNPKITSKSPEEMINKISSTQGAKEKGGGTFGNVYSHQSDKRQGQIRKVGIAGKIDKTTFKPRNTSNLEEDGYLSYLKMVYDLERSGYQNNYFPRIYNLKIFKKDDRLYYFLDMEKLVKFSSRHIDERILNSIWDNTFDLDRHGSIDQDHIAEVLQRSLYKGTFDDIKDYELSDALVEIYKLRIKGGFSADIHSDNIMLRFAGTMPQLVITDPLA